MFCLGKWLEEDLDGALEGAVDPDEGVIPLGIGEPESGQLVGRRLRLQFAAEDFEHLAVLVKLLLVVANV